MMVSIFSCMGMLLHCPSNWCSKNRQRPSICPWSRSMVLSGLSDPSLQHWGLSYLFTFAAVVPFSLGIADRVLLFVHALYSLCAQFSLPLVWIFRANYKSSPLPCWSWSNFSKETEHPWLVFLGAFIPSDRYESRVIFLMRLGALGGLTSSSSQPQPWAPDLMQVGAPGPVFRDQRERAVQTEGPVGAKRFGAERKPPCQEC